MEIKINLSPEAIRKMEWYRATCIKSIENIIAEKTEDEDTTFMYNRIAEFRSMTIGELIEQYVV